MITKIHEIDDQKGRSYFRGCKKGLLDTSPFFWFPLYRETRFLLREEGRDLNEGEKHEKRNKKEREKNGRSVGSRRNVFD